MKLRAAALGAMLGCLPGIQAHAQSYPARPLRWIVAFPAGGGADILARLLAPRVAESLGQQVVVDNRAGAGGNIGFEIAARATPDGQTLVMGSVPLATNVSLYRKLAYDPVRDFAAVTLLSSTPNLVTAHPALPARSIAELIALAKARPGQINYASGGTSTTLHLAAELLNRMAKIQLVHVPYKGAPQAMIAVLAGEVSLTVIPALVALPHVRNGAVRALAITSLERASGLPEVPTVSESGLAGYEATQWYGVLVPAHTPENIIALLNRAFVRVVQTPELKSRLERELSTPVGSTPAQLAAYLKSEIDKWTAIIKASGARAD